MTSHKNKKIFWIASYPKSGNTWMRAIIASLFFTNDGVFKFELFKKVRNFEREENYTFVKSINNKDYQNLSNIKIISKYRQEAQKKAEIFDGNFAFYKTHSANIVADNYRYTSEETTLGLIYMIRDPRDIAISYGHHKDVNLKTIINLITNESAIYDSKHPYFLSSWNHHYNSWINLQVPKLIIKYEDLLINTEKILHDIVNFFYNIYKIKFSNIEIKTKNILNSTNFKKLQDYENKFGFIEARNGKFFRKGKAMQWEKKLSKKQRDQIEKEFMTTMKILGYL